MGGARFLFGDSDYLSGTGGAVFNVSYYTLGHQDVRGLSAIDPHRRQWISVTMCKDVGMSLKPVLVTTPHMSVRGDNTTPLSNNGVAQQWPMVWS